MPGTPSGENHSSDSHTCGAKQDAAALQISPDLADVSVDLGMPQGQPQVAETFL